MLNEIGIEHPFVCVNLDWWPDSKCDYGNCSWSGAGINKLDFENEVLVQAAIALSGDSFALLRVGGTLQDHIHYNLNATGQHW